MILDNIIPGWKVFSTLVGVAVFALLAMFVYSNFFAPPNDLTSAQEKCLNRILPQVAKDVREFADAHGVYGVNVARFRGDTPNAQITQAVRSVVDSQEGIVRKKESLTAKFRQVVQGQEETEFEVAGRQEAVKYVSETNGVDFVIFGRTKLMKDGDNADVELEIFIQGATPEAKFSRLYYENTWSKNDDVEEWDGGGSEGGFWPTVGDASWRLLVFLVVAFFLPIVTGPLAIYAFRMESNAVNFLVLAGYTLLNGLLAWALMSFGFSGWIVVAILFAMTIGGFWNFRVCSVWESRA